MSEHTLYSLLVASGGPTDHHEFSVRVESAGTMSDPSLRFTVDNGHLDRLRLPFAEWHHGIRATVDSICA